MSLFQQPLVKNLPIFGCFFLAACSNIDSQNQTTDVSDIEDQTNLVVYQCEQDELLAYFHGNRAELIWQGKSHFFNSCRKCVRCQLSWRVFVLLGTQQRS